MRVDLCAEYADNILGSIVNTIEIACVIIAREREHASFGFLVTQLHLSFELEPENDICCDSQWLIG